MESIISQILVYGFLVIMTIIVPCFAITTTIWFIVEAAKICIEIYEDFIDFFRK
nr:MAG TPA: hypothetical protein [Caudoviricetes sp.]